MSLFLSFTTITFIFSRHFKGRENVVLTPYIPNFVDFHDRKSFVSKKTNVIYQRLACFLE